MAIVGAPSDWLGSAFVYRFDGSTWIEESKLTVTSGEFLGGSVAIDGDVALVAAVGDGTNGTSAGAAYVYRFDGLMWIEKAKLLASDAAPFDTFGQQVAISGDVAIVGAYLDDDNGDGSGSAYIFAGLSGLDCNGSGVPDACDIEAGTSTDANGNGVPDECDCPWDLDANGSVGVVDLLALLGAWGMNPGGPPDFDGDGDVGVTDLLKLLGMWGACP